MDDASGCMRLQKFLARAGVASRRTSEEFIVAGRVRVNGQVVSEMGVQVNPDVDIIEFDGCRVLAPAKHTTIALNKPAGVYSTMSDQKGRLCVADLVPVASYSGLFHVGRLDRDTTGILLFTNDGELGQRLLHPRHHVWKEYYAQVKGKPAEDALDHLRRGITIRQGERIYDCAPAKVELIHSLPEGIKVSETCLEPTRKGTAIVSISIHEGVKHQVKLMLGAIGHPVVNLHRATFGGISCTGLKLGEWRELKPDEVQVLEEGN